MHTDTSQPNDSIHNDSKNDSSNALATKVIHLTDIDSALMSLNSVGYTLNSSTLNTSKAHLSKSWLSGARSSKVANKSVVDTVDTHSETSYKTLLQSIDLQILPNEKISVIGPNGAGKSTLMKLMLGLMTPTSGKILRHPDLNIGYVPQKFSVPAILPLRVQDLLAQPKKQLNKDELQFIYSHLSITDLLGKQVVHLSGGETQRVLLARSLLTRPNLLILDEPMQGLDPESEHWLYEFIDDLPSFLQCAMVVVSHDLHWVMRGSRRVICLNKHICCEGQPSELEVSDEFKKLFGHQYEQPYIHKPHDCQHHEPQVY